MNKLYPATFFVFELLIASFANAHIDNQEIISYKAILKMSAENTKLGRIAIQRYFSANPKPIAGIKELKTNGFEKVKELKYYNIAILGDGIDYNYPSIANKTIYSYSKNGNIIGAGHDFIARDSWAAPYLAKTNDLDPDSPFYLLNDSSQNSENSSIKVQEMIDLYSKYEIMAKNISIFNQNSIQKNPSESNNLLLDSNRNLLSEELEYKNSFIGSHGTAVADIFLSQTSHLKVLPLRISPINPIYQANKIIPQTFQEEFILQNIIDSIDYAAKENVSLIYIPIGTYESKNNTNKNHANDKTNQISGLNQNNKRHKELIEKLKQSILNHPNIIFAIYAEDSSFCHLELDISKIKNSFCVTQKKNKNKDNNISDEENQIQPVKKTYLAKPSNQCLDLEYIFKNSKGESEEKYFELIEKCLTQKNILSQNETSLNALYMIKEIILKLSFESGLRKDFLGINIQSKKQHMIREFKAKIAILNTLKTTPNLYIDDSKYNDQIEIY